MKSVGKYHLIDFGLSVCYKDNLAPGEIDPNSGQGKAAWNQSATRA